MKLNCAIAIIVAALCSMLLLTSCTYTREDIKNADEKGYERGYDYGYKDGYKDGESSTSGDVEGLENHIDELYDEISYYQGEVSVLQDKANALDWYVVFVGHDNKYYHKYDCSRLILGGGFYVFNSETADAEGFIPCPYCCE